MAVTTLDPTSPYRIVEWYAFWPALRLLGAAETVFGVTCGMRHKSPETGIRAYRESSLHRLLVSAGLRPVDAVSFDVSLLVPPLDRCLRRATWLRKSPEDTVSRGSLRWLGSAYLVASRKPT